MINDGLILPFRFYDALEKQMRYRGCGRYATQDEIRHNEYLIAYGCKLLPFQIKRATHPSTTTTLTIVNVNTGVETNLTSYVDSSDWDISTVGENDYITYRGNVDILDSGDCLFDDCVYYATFSDGNDTWYSELFKVIQSGFSETDYRIWSTGRGCFRVWEDDDDLRITK